MSLISIILNFREKDRLNNGNIDELLTSIYNSVDSVSNLEILFKIDNDDELAKMVLDDRIAKNPQLSMKYVVSPRVFYEGLHIGYSDCLSLLGSDCVAIFLMADDMTFTPQSKWDKKVIERSRKHVDNIFFFQMTPVGDFTDGIIFSKKIIDVVGFGPTYATDQWGWSLTKVLISSGYQDKVESIGQFVGRKGCALDFPNCSDEGDRRWFQLRHKMMTYIQSLEYNELVQQAGKKIIEEIV